MSSTNKLTKNYEKVLIWWVKLLSYIQSLNLKKISLRLSRPNFDTSTGFPAKSHLIGWSKIPTWHGAIRSTSYIWEVTRHQYGVPTAVVISRDTSGSVAKSLLFSQASFGRLCELFTFQKNLLTTWPWWTPGAHTDRSIFPRKSVQTHPLTTWCGNSSQLHLNKGLSIVVESTYT